jgi:hypothetical protein
MEATGYTEFLAREYQTASGNEATTSPDAEVGVEECG